MTFGRDSCYDAPSVNKEIFMSPRNEKLSPIINGRLLGYATLAGAALAAPAIPNADATIISSGPVNINIPSTTSGVYFNVVTGAFDTTPGGAPGWDLNLWSASSLEIWANNSASASDGVLDNFPGGNAGSVDNLPAGTLIDGAYNYGRTDGSVETSGPTAFALNGDQNLFGFRFLNEGTGTYDFGWAQISLSSTLGGQPRAIIEYAYEDTGAAILAGDTGQDGSASVPDEGGTASLFGLSILALGALAVREWRGQRAGLPKGKTA